MPNAIISKNKEVIEIGINKDYSETLLQYYCPLFSL
jgi:hypothetical protein